MLAFCLCLLARPTVRLVNGDNTCSGRVEVYSTVLQSYGTVCGHGYWDMQHAQVVCRQVGCGLARSAIYGPFGGSSFILMAGVRCTGSEFSLTECIHRAIGNIGNWCDHRYDAAVICEGECQHSYIIEEYPPVTM